MSSDHNTSHISPTDLRNTSNAMSNQMYYNPTNNGQIFPDIPLGMMGMPNPNMFSQNPSLDFLSNPMSFPQGMSLNPQMLPMVHSMMVPGIADNISSQNQMYPFQQLCTPFNNLIASSSDNSAKFPRDDFQNIDFNHDVWLQAISDDNKTYYVEVKTRRTQWECPENIINPILDHKSYEAIKNAYAKWLSQNQSGDLTSTDQLSDNNLQSRMSLQNGTLYDNIDLPKDPKTGQYIVPSEVIEWSEHKSGNSVYYYNSRTKKSVWEKPDALIKWEANKKSMVLNQSDPLFISKTISKQSQDDNLESNKNLTRSLPSSTNKEDLSSQKITNFKLTLKIPGTTWHVVKPSKGKIFYYNESTHSSTYNLHNDLKNRSDIEDLKEKLVKNFDIKMKEMEEEMMRNKEKDLYHAISSNDNVSSQNANNDNYEKNELEPKRVKSAEYDEKISNILQQYNEMSLEQRQKIFYELLAEKNVSAFSTWKFELHKIVNDDRYLCLTSGDRRDVFDKYCRDRANDEKQQKDAHYHEIRTNFETLMKEAKIDRKTSFLEFSAKFSRDPRFKAFEKKKERESLFDSYQATLKQNHAAKQKQHNAKKSAFYKMLQEFYAKYNNKIPRNFKDARKLFGKDQRYIDLDSKSLRVKYFEDFQVSIMQNDQNRSSKSSISRHNMNDRRSTSERSNYTKDKIMNHMTQEKLEREKIQLIQKELCSILSSILADVCRDPSLEWNDVKSKVHDDPRWVQCKKMTKRSRDNTFSDHITMLNQKYQNILTNIFKELKLEIGIEWSEDLLSEVKKHPNFSKISSWSNERIAREFSIYIKNLKKKMIEDFKDLLHETKIISYKTNRQLEENPGLFTDIIAILEKDRRYLVMNKHMKDERRDLLITHIEKLEKRGVPPSIHLSK